MFLTETGLIYRGIRPLQKLGELGLSNPLSALSLQAKAPLRLRCVPPDPWSGDAMRGRDMIAGSFRFAGQAIEREQLSWMPDGARPEWLAELHGFEWLRDLRSVGGDRARRMAREMVASWFDRFQKPCDIAWRADITGARLAAWISFHDFFCASADDAFRRDYMLSLVRQTRWLAKALPGQLTGIPLIRALKGLAYAAIAVEGEEERLTLAFRHIAREIRIQILPDGGHVTRSPQATFDFFQCLVDLRTTLVAARLEVPEEIQHAIDRLAPAVKFFRHGDGAFVQFNGGQEGNANICDATLMHSGARGRAMKEMPHSGYARINLGRAALIMDIASAAAASRRLHAGPLAFEYSFGKDRVFVNCGTVGYKGTWQDLLRATAAHNTLTVDNRNACQFDDKGKVSAWPEVAHKRHEDHQLATIDASHNGYMPRFGLTHRRRLSLLEQGDVLQGLDNLSGRSGAAFALRFHLHPGIQAVAVQDGGEILLRARSGAGWRFRAEGFSVSIDDSIYAGEGDTPRRSQQLVISGVSDGATSIAWELRREKIGHER